MQERVPALVFSLRTHTYCLLQDGSATLLPWLQRYTTVSPVPGTPAWMLGVFGVHGTIQPIVDIGLFMGHGAGARDNGARLVFIERGELCVGLLVDGAAGIRYLDRVEQGAVDEPFLLGTATLGGKPIRILDGGGLIEALARTLDTSERRA